MTALASNDLFRSIAKIDAPVGLLDGVSAAIRKYVGWHVSPERVDTFTLDGTGGHYLLLPSAHVVDVLAVTNAGDVIDPLDLEWSSAGLVKLPGRWTDKMRGITITVQHGWNDVPDLAVQAVLIAARVTAAPHGESLAQVGGVSFQMGASGMALTPGEEALLTPYCVAGR
jgi:hypothetical protein